MLVYKFVSDNDDMKTRATGSLDGKPVAQSTAHSSPVKSDQRETVPHVSVLGDTSMTKDALHKCNAISNSDATAAGRPPPSCNVSSESADQSTVAAGQEVINKSKDTLKLSADAKDLQQKLLVHTQDFPNVDSLSIHARDGDLSPVPPRDDVPCAAGQPSLSRGSYQLAWRRRFAAPVFAIDSRDVVGDGLGELIVLTQTGVHVLQVRPQSVVQKLNLLLSYVLICQLSLRHYCWHMNHN